MFGAKNFLDKKFIVLLSDVFISMNIKKFISYSLNKKTDCTIVSHSNSHPKDSDTVEFDKRGKVTSIIFKNSKKNKINSSMAGVYFFKKKFLNKLKFKKNHSYDLVKNIIGKSFKNNIFSYHTIEYIKDFGTIERLKKVRNDIKLKLHIKNIYNKKKAAVFLDRDGVINREIGPIRNPKNLKLLKNSSKAIKLLNERQIPCFLITNQSIISKRKITINNFKSLIAKLDNELSKVNAYIDDLRICPNSDKKKINVRKHYFLSKYRKPNPGMLFEIKKKHNIDLKKSFYVGDTDIDMLTSYNAKCRKILLLNEKKMKKYKYNVLPDWIVLNLQTAVKKIILKKIK